MILDFNETIKYMDFPSREEDEEFFRRYREIYIYLDQHTFENLKTFYYLEIIKYLYENGDIHIFLYIEKGIVVPSRLEWILKTRDTYKADR